MIRIQAGVGAPARHARGGKSARWLLVIGLLVGIAAMHALSCSMDTDDHQVGPPVEHAVTATASSAAPAGATAGVLPVSVRCADAAPSTGACGGLCCAQPSTMCLAVLTTVLIGLGAARWAARAVPPGSRRAGGMLAATRAGLATSALLAHGTLLRV